MIGCSASMGGPAMRRPNARLGIEPLEGRALLSGNAALHAVTAPRSIRASSVPVNLNGNWALQGRDPNGTRWLADLVIRQASNGKALSGFFDWQANGYAAYGREDFTGTYDPVTRSIRLV